MVLFAGIAAEALIYGEAEGGENDENLFRSTCALLQPPLSIAEVYLQLICTFFKRVYTRKSFHPCLLNLATSFFVMFLQRCQIKQDGLFYNLTIFSNGIRKHTELLLKLLKVVVI